MPAGDSEIHLLPIQTLSLENVQTNVVINILSCSFKFLSWSVGSQVPCTLKKVLIIGNFRFPLHTHRVDCPENGTLYLEYTTTSLPKSRVGMGLITKSKMAVKQQKEVLLSFSTNLL